jgi:hypothetical protein
MPPADDVTKPLKRRHRFSVPSLPAGSSDVLPPSDAPGGGRNQRTTPRQRHRPVLRRMLVSAGVAAVLAGATAALLAASATPAPTALTAVTSALARTSADSYSFSLDSAIQVRGHRVHSDVVSGAFDPRHGLGAESLASTRAKQGPVTAQVRFIGRYMYMRVSSGPGALGRPWNKAPVPSAAADGMPPEYEVYGFVTDQPVSPAEFSRVLRSAGTVRDEGPASGAGWTGIKYVLTAHFPQVRQSVTATVYVDQQGRVRHLVTITTQGAVTTDRDLTFGDFGSPVSATAPLASQVKYTSRPYWGFLF